MNLADLIKGKKNTITLPPANANPAKVAKVDPVLAVFEPRLAGLATLALAESEQTDIFKPGYLDSGTPAADSKPNLYCESGGCHCSQMLPAANYPNGCGKCEYYGEPPATTEPEAPQAFHAPAPISTHAPITCRACKGRDFWQSVHGLTVCRKCHPPMEGAEREK